MVDGPSLSTSCRLLICQMQLYRHTDQVWVSKRELGRATMLPKRTLIKKLKELTDAGLVEADAGIDETHGGYKATMYRLKC